MIGHLWIQHIETKVVGAPVSDPYGFLRDKLIQEAVQMSQDHKANVKFTWDGVEITVAYQQVALAGSFLVAKERGETVAIA